MVAAPDDLLHTPIALLCHPVLLLGELLLQIEVSVQGVMIWCYVDEVANTLGKKE